MRLICAARVGGDFQVLASVMAKNAEVQRIRRRERDRLG